jgi:predicted enzyme related to lactoylglutathione lyase
MEMVKDAINWFEIPVSDFERARKFYSAIFDYEMPTSEMGPVTMGFLLSEQGMGVGGAIVKGDGYTPGPGGTLVYLNGGSDLGPVLGRVEDAGGKVVTTKTQITPDLGHYAVFTDSEGNRVALHSMG